MSAHFLSASRMDQDAEDSNGQLLTHVIGKSIGKSRLRNQPITIRSAMQAPGQEPIQPACRPMSRPAETAATDLTEILSKFRIDGVRCPEPEKYARGALRRAGAEFLSNPLVSNYGHCATALLGIAALGILLVF